MSVSLKAQVALGLVLVLAGIALNYLTIGLLWPIEFIFTPIVLFLAVRSCSLIPALTICLIILLHMTWAYDGAGNPLLYMLQTTVYYWAVQKRYNPVIFDLLYWLLVGMPIAAILTFAVYDLPTDMLGYTIILKQPVNGVFCVLIANLIISSSWFKSYRKGPLKLEHFVRDLLLAAFVIPLLMVVFLVKIFIDQRNIDTVEQKNSSYALVNKTNIESFLNEYIKGIETLAKNLSINVDRPRGDIQKWLDTTRINYQQFSTMLIADKAGDLVFASPENLMGKATNISDRKYFRVAIEEQKSFISEAFLGRGFGIDPIVALSTPLLDDKDELKGMIQGALNLDRFEQLIRLPENSDAKILITDKKDRVVYATPELQLDFLSDVDITVSPDEIYSNNIHIAGIGRLFIFSKAETFNGWSIFVLDDRQEQVGLISQSYIALLLIALLSILFILIITTPLARKFNEPLNELLTRYKGMARLEKNTEKKERNSTFEEIETLFNHLYLAHNNLLETYEANQSALAEKIQAEKQSEAKSELLSKVSHELRTPLNAILGQVQLLAMETKDNETKAVLTRVEKAGKFLIFLIDDLLMLSKSQSGEFKLELKSQALKPLIEDSISLLEENITRREIAFTVDIATANNIFVKVDALRLQQVISNILSNAIKYNAFKGKVGITVEKLEKKIVIHIDDEGFGIPKEYHHRVFQPFNRLGQEHSSIDGTGIGLALAKELIESMGGNISFISKEGEGSRFSILLPISEVKENSGSLESQSNELSIDLSNKSVLYIEDNNTNYLILSAWLKRKNANIAPIAANGEAGLKAAEENDFDLIFVDLGLPDCNGLDLLPTLKRSCPQAKIFALTADNSDSSRQRAEEIGFDAFMTKPVIFDQVEATLLRFI